MSLLDCFLMILAEWEAFFVKQPSYRRAVLLAIASLSVVGRACISRIISFLGFDQKDWSAHYKLFSRSFWEEFDLFQPIIKNTLPLINDPFIAVAFDDTKLKKTGKKIKTAFYQRDPLSPPFHVNFLYGLRFLQGSLLVPMYQKNNQPPRSLPITFKEVPAVKKPSKKATEEEWVQYQKDQKRFNLSHHFLVSAQEIRKSLDAAGVAHKTMIAVVDGSFCNKTCMGTPIERTCLVARARKDAKLCFKADNGSRRFYDDKKFTPEQVRQDDCIPWKKLLFIMGENGERSGLKKFKKCYGSMGQDNNF